MIVFYWFGFVLGVALFFSPLCLLVPPVRRRVIDVPLFRLVTGRWHRRRPDYARIARLSAELAAADEQIERSRPAWPYYET